MLLSTLHRQGPARNEWKLKLVLAAAAASVWIMGSAVLSTHLARSFTCSLWEKILEHLPPIWGTADKYLEAWSASWAVAFWFLADLVWYCWKLGAVTAFTKAEGQDFCILRSQLVSESITPTSHHSGFSSNWHPHISLNNRCRLTEPMDYWLCVSSTTVFLFCTILSTERLHPIHSHVNAKVTSQGVVFKPLKYLFKSANVAGNS